MLRRPLMLDKSTFHSQYGEDRFLAARRRLPRDGVFVDVGAGDPIRFSNTYYFEQHGWTGLCVDADTRQVEALRRVRTCVVEWAAVASIPAEVEFLQADEPEYSTTLGHLPQLASTKGWQVTSTRVPAVRLETILERHKIGPVDLLSIDTEGTELDVCDSLDWEAHRPRVVIIEFATAGLGSQYPAIREYFASLPYRLINRTSSNLIFSWTRAPRSLRRHSTLRAYREKRRAESQVARTRRAG
jgi:FkbM family methyltransferase